MKPSPVIRCISLLAVLCAMAPGAPTARAQALFLHEMTWAETADYLKRSDMVIIPMGSTEQHGPHLPLGTDIIVAEDIASRVSARTGVVVAKILSVGQSEVHMGFPGTISISPGAMERVLVESAESLIRHGFRKFMFFNYHGGNSVVQQNVLFHINNRTPATAVAIGLGSVLRWESPAAQYERFFDWHAGVGETSLMMHLRPGMVRRDRLGRPNISLSGDAKAIRESMKRHPELGAVFSAMVGTPSQAGKRGSSAEMSGNGVWSMDDTSKATAEIGRVRGESMVEAAVRFINAWREAEAGR